MTPTSAGSPNATSNYRNIWLLIRWEKAGLPRDAVRSQCWTCSKHEKKTGNEKDYRSVSNAFLHLAILPIIVLPMRSR